METYIKCLVCGILFDLDGDENDPRICMGHWKCPKCGVGTEYTDEDGREVEGLIDEGDDYVHCRKCEGTWTYRGIEKAIMKKNDVIICPFCKGQGAVQKKKAAKFKETK